MSKAPSNRIWWLLVLCLGLLNLAALRRSHLGDWVGGLALKRVSADSPNAENYLEIANWLHPDSPEVAFARARQARRANEMRQFESQLSRAKFLGLVSDKLDRETWFALAQSGQMRLVRDKLAKLTDAPGGDEAEICEAFAIGFMRVREFSSALTLLNAWALDFPKDARPHAWIGQIYGELKDQEQAEAAYRKALSIDSSNSSAALGLGNLLLEVKRPDEARQYFVIAAGDPQVAAAAGAGLADALLAMGESAEAEKVLIELLETQPEHHQLLTSLANLYVEQGQFEQAEAVLRAEVDAGSSRRELRYAYALALRGLGRADDAMQHFDYAAQAAKEIIRAKQRIVEIEEKPQDLELRFDIGSTLLKFGNTEDGLMWLQSVLEMQPKHPGAHRALGEYFAGQIKRDPQAHIKARQHFALAGSSR